MTLLEAMERRHSVRSYTDQPICGEVLASLEREVRAGLTERASRSRLGCIRRT